MVRSMANGAMLLAIEKGYFKEIGIKVELEDLQSSATAMASLAQGQLNIIAGGVSAGYFNALEKNLPIIITVDRVTTPIRHNLMIRPDLKDQIKEIKDLKGKVIASNAPGSISTYEIGKMLAKAGLTFTDVEIKIIPFPQIRGGLDQQGGRCGADHPAVHLQPRRQEHRAALRRGRRDRRAAPADHRGQHDQHRLGEGEPAAGAQLLRRLDARRARLLPGLSRRVDCARS